MKQSKGVGKFIKEAESDLIQASAREISFSLYRLLTGKKFYFFKDLRIIKNFRLCL